ncbi:ABC transporter ATP-binding protein [Aliivibrio fischeri]|uniref:ABC transporter ATP-binding protein n=1 Tax=Aliivibrio fischeri TaxID=668 RepID=UPI0007C479F1|nr:ABC transporter ATP-binding protein [Aliivibrio fischeri]
MKSALSISNLTCRYHDQDILSQLSLNVEQGEIVCLLGASGCGKTTLLKSIAGLLPLSSGEMNLNGKVITDNNTWLPPEQRNIGMIFQDYALFPHLTVTQNIGFGLKDWDKKKADDKVESMLHLVHLDGFGDRYPHQLSGGQQQRVAIARALASEPDLLLLDEPFSNIDTQVRHDLIKEIRRIFKAQGVTAIFVTHSREEAFAFSDKLAVMNHGVIEQFGSSNDLYYSPNSRFVADFLGGGSYVSGTINQNGNIDTQVGFISCGRSTTEADKKAEVLLRPQNITLYRDVNGEATVKELQFMGDTCRYVIDSKGVELIAVSNDSLTIGEKVKFEIKSHCPIVFVQD